MINRNFRRNIICIDLKSFFASCECIDKGLDPFSYPLVVTNPDQGNGAMTLAVTPFLKKQGVKSRCRLYEIPKNIKYVIAKPRMNLYVKMSKEVVNVYLEYVAKEDLHVYSIDECFLDLTSYMNLYKKSDYDIALDILNRIKEKTGLTATCGIGPNMLLAKIAMDIEAKHTKDCIAKWDYDDVEKKLWNITPLSKMWGIGPRMEKNLNALGITSVGQLANYSLSKLKSKFGILGEELWQHANGIDNSVISDFEHEAKDQSYSQSQVLFKDYYGDNIKIIISEMIDNLAARLRLNKTLCTVIGFGINYSKSVGGGFYHSMKLANPSDNTMELFNYCNMMFERFYEDLPIRKVSIVFGGIVNNVGKQLTIFEDSKDIKKEKDLNDTIDAIKKKYGKNSLLKASALLNDSTAMDRNKKVGGHNAE